MGDKGIFRPLASQKPLEEGEVFPEEYFQALIKALRERKFLVKKKAKPEGLARKPLEHLAGIGPV